MQRYHHGYACKFIANAHPRSTSKSDKRKKSGGPNPSNLEGSNFVGIGNTCGDICVWLANQNTYNINKWNMSLISNLEYMLTTLMPEG